MENFIVSVVDFIRRQILRYRDRLANFSRRNKELYYRESRGHAINLSKIPVVSEECQDIISETYVPLYALSTRFQEIINDSKFDLSKHFLIDETNDANLIKKLDKVRLADNKFQKEYGISGAWLLGPFLCWRESVDYKAGDLLISPIFKIAVNIIKDKRKKWSLQLEDNTLKINPSLKLALRQKWGIKLPEEFESDQVENAISELIECFKKNDKNIIYDHVTYDAIPKIASRFNIIKDDAGEIIERRQVELKDVLSKKDLGIYSKVTNKDFLLIDNVIIDHLNASRTVLIRDYESILEDTEMHPILSELFLGKPIPRDTHEDYEKIKQLDQYKERENYFVVNIDSSQHRAIDQTTKNNVVVIQGPPGTGKSQTITNLISDSMAKGKTVLFVSEKRAALDVVYARLQQANLAKQSVLIHSSDLNKQKLYNSFLELSDSVHDSEADDHWQSVTEDFDNLKTDINNYYNSLEQKHLPSGLTISDIFSIYADSSIENINIEVAKIFSTSSFSDLKKVCELFNDLQVKVSNIKNYSNHPWLYKKKNAIYTASFTQQITNLVSTIKKLQGELCLIRENATKLAINDFTSIPDTTLIKEIINSNIPSDWINFSNQFYLRSDVFTAYKMEIEKIVSIFENEKNYYTQVMPDANIEIVKQLESYYSLKHSFIEWFSPTYWKMKNYRKQLVTNWDGTNRCFKSYRLMLDAINAFNNIQQNKLLPIIVNNAQDLFEACQKILPVINLSNKIGIVLEKMKLSNNDIFSTLTIESYKNINTLLSKSIEIKVEFDDIKIKLSAHVNELLSYLDNQSTLINGDNFDYDILINHINDLPMLDQIDMCLENISQLNDNFSKKILIDQFIPIESNWSSYIIGCVIKWWIDEVISHNPCLRHFDKQLFQNKLQQFKSAEENHRTSAREYVNNTFSKRWMKGVGEFTGLTLLKKKLINNVKFFHLVK